MINLPLKNLKILFALFLLTVSSTVSFSAQSLILDNNFSGGVSDASPTVYVSAIQPNGKILVGGLFHLTNGVQKPFLTRLNEDGTIDLTFNPSGSGPNSHVFDIVVLTDGKILIGGSFTAYNGTAKSGLTRLNADGSLDPTFNAGGAGAGGTVQTIVLQTDGKILISGSVFSYNNAAKFSVARVNADGTLDATFTSPFTTNFFVEGIGVQADGKILIGGSFSINGYSNFARLNKDGSLDTTFSSGGTDGGVYALSLQTDGKILIGGEFTTYRNNFRPKIARLNSDGTLDASFNPGSLDGASAEYFIFQPDGKILAAGKFVDFFNQEFSLIRLNADGSLDNTFQLLPSNNSGYNARLQEDGKIILTGLFTKIGGENKRGIVRLNPDGDIDNSFHASFSNWGLIDAVAQQVDGKIIVGGSFETANGAARTGIARFNLDGTLDTNFKADTVSELNFPGFIYDIAVQPNGKILVGGLGHFNSTIRTAIVRLNSDGTLDTSFDLSYINSTETTLVYNIFVQDDGKILLGGLFSSFFNQSFTGLIRLNSDGSFDDTFGFNGNGPNSTVRKIVQQPDGKFVIGGSFSTYNGQSRARIARISADGTLDISFNPGTGTNSSVYDVALQEDSKILIGGNFTTYNGTSRNRFARLNTDGSLDTAFNVGTGADDAVYTIAPQPNGKILIGGFFSGYDGKTSSKLVRTNADGSFDNTFTSGFADSPIYNVRQILNQTDGKVLIGGVFDFYNGIARNSLLRLTTAVRQPVRFDFDGDGKADISVFRPDNGVWYLLNSQSGFTAAQFGVSTDKLVPADYDGDGKTDLAVYRAGTWYLNRSSTGFTGITFGESNDIPQPADFDGDGKADLAVFRPSNGTWYVYNLADNQFTAAQFGLSIDKPAVGDYDGDGKADYAVYRAGTWYLQRSAAGFTGIEFGENTDLPVPADYDGDGKTDIAVFRPSNGNWYRLNSSNGQFSAMQFGTSTDLPVQADYDGDGKADIAVFRDGTWYLQQSAAGFTGVQFGTVTDVPVPDAFIRQSN